MAANFCWRSTDESRKMHWGTWDKLCVWKTVGGLDFRNLECCNKPLLAIRCGGCYAILMHLPPRCLRKDTFSDLAFSPRDGHTRFNGDIIGLIINVKSLLSSRDFEFLWWSCGVCGTDATVCSTLVR